MLDVRSIGKIINLLIALSEGCKEHPAYRAKRQPRINCEGCHEMWDARQKLVDAKILK